MNSGVALILVANRCQLWKLCQGGVRSKLLEESFAKNGNGVVVWVGVGSDIQKCNRIVGGMFEFTAG